MNAWLLPAWVSGLMAAALTLLGFEAALRALSPGVYARSRYTYVLVVLALSPSLWAVVWALPALLHAVGLMLWAVAFFARVMDTGRWGWLLAFGLTALLAAWLSPSLLLVCAPLALVLLAEHPRWRLGAAALLAAGVVGWAWGRADAIPSSGEAMAAWSLRYFFIKPEGAPNAAVLWQPLAHPFFCLPLPALLLLFKKTDVGLYARRALLFSLAALMLYFSGLHALTPVRLLPAYVLLLLLLFPAWDRFFAYGGYFFPRLTLALVGLAGTIQVLALIFFLT